jgi:hypothetical protein
VFHPAAGEKATKALSKRNANKLKMEHRERREKEKERVEEGSTVENVGEKDSTSSQATKDGFEGRGGRGDRFFGMEKVKGMTFYSVTNG